LISFANKHIYDSLNVSTITSLLDTYLGVPCLYFDMMLNSAISTELKTINYYMYVPVNLAQEYEKYSYSINCRAKTWGEAVAIADAVVNSINRVSYNSNYFLTCKSLPCQAPRDERDNYLVPLEVTIKLKNES
jgi:hypothetical protein